MRKQFILVALVLLLTGCATYKSKYLANEGRFDIPDGSKPSHTFFLIGDAGLSPAGEMNPALSALRQRLSGAEPNSTVLFLGDNIYPAGLPDPEESPGAYLAAKNQLDAQLAAVEGFKGRVHFIPGNHDWYADGLRGLERQQEYIQERLEDKNAFLPEDGCPLEVIAINEKLTLILIDTEWYLTTWDKHPEMNDKCSIKSREKFLEELEGLIKENRGKTTVLAMHHPMFSYGVHGGQFSFREHLFPTNLPFPLPGLGTAINLFRKTTGASIEDMFNKRYLELRKKLVTLAQYSDKVIFASGHEHTLQYIVEENTPQIVSGSGAKKGATRMLNGSRFSTGSMGYATLDVYTDGSSRVRFYGVEETAREQFLYTAEVLPPDRQASTEVYGQTFPSEMEASIYTPEEVDRGGLHKTLWGARYRKYYGTRVKAPVALLDTLYGGLEPVRTGGGHQSKSLRLRHADGREFVMRALRKNAELYLQAMAFKDQYIVGEFEDTYTEDLLLDFYTGSNPYAPFTLGVLSDAVGLFHTNPVLYYIPRQPALGGFNESFGDELYMIEEHAGDGHGSLASFGYSDELKSTDSMLEDLREDEKYEVDTRMYLRARLFDMVIGDWDRHVDQWRWAEFRDEARGTITYKPVPRDRDMAYSKYGDGLIMNLASRMIPGLRIMEGFREEIRNVRGFNSSPQTYVLDLALLSETGLTAWEEEAETLRTNLNADVIDRAFEGFPEEVRDETLTEIKRILLARAAAIVSTARSYYKILNTYAIVTGTDKDDWFEIHCPNEEEVEIKGYRIIKGEKDRMFFSRTFNKEVTREIWVYGLDDDDRFEVGGTAGAAIKIRLIGGQNNDIYEVGDHNSRVRIYDHKSKKNTFKSIGGAKLHILDDYEVNTYRPLNIRQTVNQFLPTVGFNPDDGVKIGFSNTYTYNGFRQNPFTQKHRFNAAYYFATNGFELGYQGEFANLAEHWNLALEGRFTSPNFSINFFGFGNDTPNEDDALGFDYNRVKLQTISLAPSLVWRGELGGKFRTGISYESIEVEQTADRFINTFYQNNDQETQNDFLGIDAEYTYTNRDSEAFPTVGMATGLQLGYKTNTQGGSRNFGYIIPSLSLDHSLLPGGRLVLATKWKAHVMVGDGYEFYQAASLGASDGLRGFRNQRFTGKTAYYQLTDLRYSITRLKTGLLPLGLGLYGGYDYGRVWFPGDASNTWHTSYGGGFFLNGADIVTATLALFNGDDGLRFSFGLGFGF